MPYLFCKPHGQEHAADCEKDQDTYRQLGETVMIVSGRLHSGGWLCDRCNVPLKIGATAYLLTSYPEHFARELEGYDYANERHYFQMESIEVNIYGAMPPGGVAPVMLEEDY